MITCATVTHVGGREVNEDFLAVSQKEGACLLALADGLGGHGQGEVASRAAVECAVSLFEEGGGQENLLQNCMEESHQALLDLQTQEGHTDQLKTTLCLLFLEENRARWAHCGDSRIYVFQKHKLLCRSVDHSVPALLCRAGQIKEKEIRFHEDRNRLLWVLGTEAPLKYDLAEPLAIKPPMSFLLCSDGFWELVTEKQMSAFLKGSDSPEEWLESMEYVVRANGNPKTMDNYTAIAAFVR